MNIKASYIGERIAEKRKQKGLTQTELAQMVGVLQKDISRWENGKHAPSSEAIIKICQALECPLADIV